MGSRFLRGVLIAGAAAAPWFATAASAESLQGEEARRFVAGKLFAFNCFDGSRGAGRIMADGSVAGSIQFSGKGQLRYARLPSNTLRVTSGGAICASVKGIPFEPCFNVVRSDDKNFRGSVSGMSFAYCDFHHQGQGRIAMAARISQPRSLHAPVAAEQHADATPAQPQPVARIEKAAIEPAKVEPLELRKSAE